MPSAPMLTVSNSAAPLPKAWSTVTTHGQRAAPDNVAQQGLAVVDRTVAQVVAVELEQVEGKVC
jgi:hypothetical protein